MMGNKFSTLREGMSMESREKAAFKAGLLRAAEIVRQRGKDIGGAIDPEITAQAILKEADDV